MTLDCLSFLKPSSITIRDRMRTGDAIWLKSCKEIKKFKFEGVDKKSIISILTSLGNQLENLSLDNCKLDADW